MKSKSFVKALTYAPKIAPLLKGEITRTIRPLFPVECNGKPVYATKYPLKGDSILFHGWGGRPYFSPWTWRARVTLTDVVPIMIFKEGIVPCWWGAKETDKSPAIPWVQLDDMAKLDGFQNGIEMGGFFNTQYKLISCDDIIESYETVRYFIILKWDTIKVESL